MAEIIKHALIERPSSFNYLEKEWQALLSLEAAALKKAVVDSIAIKSKIVQSDEKEKGGKEKTQFWTYFGTCH